MIQDLRYAVRSLLRRKALFGVAVATLALGVGASTSLFSIVNAVLLRPLPYRGSERMAVLWHVFGQGAQDLPAMHQKDYADYRDRSKTLEALTIARGSSGILGDASDPQIVQIGLVAANFFDFLGVRPQLGRIFHQAEDERGGPDVAILSDSLWRSRFGADPAIVGRTILLRARRVEVVGVLPAGFKLELPAETFQLRDSEVYQPAQIDFQTTSSRTSTTYTVFARLTPSASFAQAQRELSAIATQLRAEHPDHEAADLRVKVIPFHHDVVKGTTHGLWMLMAAVGLLLAIACTNVALLMLARGRSRDRELLVRVAVGASRGRISRLVFAESMVIAACGGLLGIALARLALVLVWTRTLSSVPRLDAVSIDVAVLAFAVGTTATAAIGCGLLAAWRASRVDLADALRAAAIGSPSRRTGVLRDGLIVMQIALGLVLVVGAGLVVQSFRALAAADPGFNPRGVLTMRVVVPLNSADTAAVHAYNLDVNARLQQLPGVTGVGIVSQLPLTGQGPLQSYAYDERTARAMDSLSAEALGVLPGYFEAVGATLLAGRDFTSDDIQNRRRLIVVDDSLAKQAFGSAEKAIGARLRFGPDGAPTYSEIIGVVGHVKYHDLRQVRLPQIYRAIVRGTYCLVIRTDADPALLTGPVRRLLAEAMPGTAIQNVRLLETIVDDALAPHRLAVWLMTGFGVMALVLAAVGIYGVFSCFVGERTREIAVRIALGASPGSVRRLVVLRGMNLLATGLVLGLMAAVVLSRAASSLLYAVSALDVATYAGAVICLAAVAAAACWVPAHRASRVDPQVGLRL